LTSETASLALIYSLHNWAVRVLVGEDRGITQLGERGALGGGRFLAAIDARLGRVHDQRRELGAHVLLRRCGQPGDRGADVALGEFGVHVRTPRPWGSRR